MISQMGSQMKRLHMNGVNINRDDLIQIRIDIIIFSMQAKHLYKLPQSCKLHATANRIVKYDFNYFLQFYVPRQLNLLKVLQGYLNINLGSFSRNGLQLDYRWYR